MINRFSPAIVSGFAAAVLMTIPAFKSLTCCFILPLAAWLTLYFDQRINGKSHIPGGKGAALGLTTGITAAILATGIDIILTMIFKSNDFVFGLPQMEKELSNLAVNLPIADLLKQLRMIAKEITQSGFSALYVIYTLIGNMLSGILFGLVGGLVGATFINRRNSEKRDE